MPKAMSGCDKIGKSTKGGEIKHLTSLKPTATIISPLLEIQVYVQVRFLYSSSSSMAII